MEFKAIIDAKARNESGCAVVGVYEEGDLGIAAAQIDKQLDGLLGKLHGNGDFSGKLGDVMLLPTPAGMVGAPDGAGRRAAARALAPTLLPHARPVGCPA